MWARLKSWWDWWFPPRTPAPATPPVSNETAQIAGQRSEVPEFLQEVPEEVVEVLPDVVAEVMAEVLPEVVAEVVEEVQDQRRAASFDPRASLNAGPSTAVRQPSASPTTRRLSTLDMSRPSPARSSSSAARSSASPARSSASPARNNPPPAEDVETPGTELRRSNRVRKSPTRFADEKF